MWRKKQTSAIGVPRKQLGHSRIQAARGWWWNGRETTDVFGGQKGCNTSWKIKATLSKKNTSTTDSQWFGSHKKKPNCESKSWQRNLSTTATAKKSNGTQSFWCKCQTQPRCKSCSKYYSSWRKRTSFWSRKKRRRWWQAQASPAGGDAFAKEMKKAFEMEEGEYLATSYEETENGFLSSPTWRKRGTNYRRRSTNMGLFCAKGGEKMQFFKDDGCLFSLLGR